MPFKCLQAFARFSLPKVAGFYLNCRRGQIARSCAQADRLHTRSMPLKDVQARWGEGKQLLCLRHSEGYIRTALILIWQNFQFPDPLSRISPFQVHLRRQVSQWPIPWRCFSRLPQLEYQILIRDFVLARPPAPDCSGFPGVAVLPAGPISKPECISSRSKSNRLSALLFNQLARRFNAVGFTCK